jgi:hypothetical protein
MVLGRTSFCVVDHCSHQVLLASAVHVLIEQGLVMRKTAVALGAVGMGAGILYAFGRARAKNNGKLRAMDGGEKVGESAV